MRPQTELRTLRFSLTPDLRIRHLAQRTAPESFQSGGQGSSPWGPLSARDLHNHYRPIGLLCLGAKKKVQRVEADPQTFTGPASASSTYRTL